VVKVPHELREAELARPVVVVKYFLTAEPEYELYVFGDRTFVVPIKKSAISGEERVKARLETLLRKYLPDSEVEVIVAEESKAVVLVNEEYYNYIVGKPRRKLERLARRLGFEIEIRPKLE